MSKIAKVSSLFSLILLLSVVLIPLNSDVYADGKTTTTKESVIESFEETKSTSENSEEPDTTSSDSKETGEGEKEKKSAMEEEGIKIQPLAAGEPFGPQHMRPFKRFIQLRVEYATGTPIEGLDIWMVAKETSSPAYGMPRHEFQLEYNNATQLYEGWYDYPYQFPRYYSQTYITLDLSGEIRGLEHGPTTIISPIIPETVYRKLRQSGVIHPSKDPDILTGSVTYTLSNAGSFSLSSSTPGLYSGTVGKNETRMEYVPSYGGEGLQIREDYTEAIPKYPVLYNLMSEYFVDEEGNDIPTPVSEGFIDGYIWGIDSPTATYKFGQTGRWGLVPHDVPMEYVSGGITYKYEGWYTGWVKPATLNTVHPIAVPVKKNEAFPIKVVYKSYVKADEQYFDENGNSLDGGSHDVSQLAGLNSTFNGAPQNIIKDSNDDYWVYQGWLKDSEIPGTDTLRVGKPSESMTKDTVFKYIYKKATPNRSLTLTPDVSVVASGDQVTWTAKVKNTSSDPISLDDTDMRLDSVPDYVANSTIVDGVPQADSFWTGTSIPLIDPSGEITIQFKTQPTGAPNAIKETVISAQSVKLAQDIVKGQVRIKDEDSKPVPPGTDFGLENVPSKFSFEDVTVNNYSQVSLLKLSSYASHTISDGLFVRLFDDRAGAPGWRLTAKLDSFKQAAHPSRTLSTGVSMDFKPKLEQVNNPNTSTETIDPSPAGSLPTIQSTVHLTSNNTDVLVMNSPAGIGDGTWQARIPLNDVQLTLPANSGIAGETYESTLTWTLSDAP
ncbi:WxL domain-containing protein [Enterococcus sp. AZ196]|uniref:WxL domain-containing protein n=1 Tax=Enterococcus sp. AZ196 TaxID=2774659 RepID=UPI003D2CF954